MTRLFAALVATSVTFLFIPRSLAGPACARRYYGDDSCLSKCASGWGFPGAVMGTDPWGSVMEPMIGPQDIVATVAHACGIPTQALGYPPTDPPPTVTPRISPSVSLSSGAPASAATPSTLTLSNTISLSPVAAITTPTTTTTTTSAMYSVVVTPTTISDAPLPPMTTVSTQSAPPVSATNQPVQPTQNPPPSGGDINAYLSAHNSVRAQHGAAPLSWSNQLADKAQQWASGCVYHHSGGSLGPYGENLAAGTGSGFGISQAIKLWTDEVSSYDPNNPQPSHFTQVVWKNTQELGCASAVCNGIFAASFGPANYFVCEYSPPGNVLGQFAQNVQA